MPLSHTDPVNYHFITAPDGVPLCVGETGNPSGPPILFLHGFSQSQAVFARQFDSDLARDFRLIGLDFRGHGSSGKPWEESAYRDSRTWAADIEVALRTLKVERPVVVAWSFGGYCTMDYVRHFSASGLAGIIFVSSHAGLGQGLPRTAQQEAGRQAQVSMLLQSPPGFGAGIAYAHDFVRQMTARPPSPAQYEVMLVSHMQLPAYARRAMATRGLENADLLDQLRLPVRFVIGQTDSSPYISEALIRGLSEKVPSGSMKVMPEAGHAVFLDAPDEFNADIRGFLASSQRR